MFQVLPWNQPQNIPIGPTLIQYWSLKRKIVAGFFKQSHTTDFCCWNLTSHNSCLKNVSIKYHHIFWNYLPWILQKISNLGQMCLRLHNFGPLWTNFTGNQWEISEVCRLSCFIDFFVWFHIVCDRYTSDYAHFTFSDTIWPLSLSSDFGTRSCTHTDTAS